jgi:hypothetical protein
MLVKTAGKTPVGLLFALVQWRSPLEGKKTEVAFLGV